LAEAAIRWRLPARVATLTGAGATLSLEARNLATWTGFGGLDPEVSTARVLPLPGIAFGQPLPRVFSLWLDVGPSGSSR
jgi:hypothetical protein